MITPQTYDPPEYDSEGHDSSQQDFSEWRANLLSQLSPEQQETLVDLIDLWVRPDPMHGLHIVGGGLSDKENAIIQMWRAMDKETKTLFGQLIPALLYNRKEQWYDEDEDDCRWDNTTCDGVN